MLAVTAFATARSMHAALLEALQQCKPRSISLTFRRANGSVTSFSIDDPFATALQRRAYRTAVIGAAACGALACLLAGGMLAYRIQSAEQTLIALSDRIAQQRKDLRESNGETASSARLHEKQALVRRRQATPLAVATLELVTASLPDDTWLTELHLQGAIVRLVGISRNVSNLIPLLGANGKFSDMAFTAPTVRQPDGSGDRFSLQARLRSEGSER
jgi:general secretion pathway protein L